MTTLQSPAFGLPASGLTLARAERTLFVLSVLAAAGIMWLAPRLPMTDLPQHAAQVALWRDLLLGQSPWADMVRINLMTPYLIGYGLMLPLSFVFSMETTTRLVLTLAFFAFVAVCVALRREFRGDRRLDWLFLLPFFGFCWKWGFMTFLVASPLGLLFILLAARHARAPSAARGLGLAAAGTILLLSHGLVFLGALFLGGLLMLEQAWVHKTRSLLARFAPYAALSAICIGFRLATQQMAGAIKTSSFAYGTPIWERPLVWLTDIAHTGDPAPTTLLFLTIAILCAPFLLGLRLNARPALVLLAGLLAILSLTPMYAFETGGVFYRFALFLPPFVAFAFRAPSSLDETAPRSRAALAALIACSWLVIGIQGSRVAAFAQESKPFETLLAAAQPGKRALWMILDGNSDAAGNESAYGHHALWYQADKHGFVDFNFAFFPPQVIRFRPERWPVRDTQDHLEIGAYTWPVAYMEQFSYMFMRGTDAKLELIRKMSPCPLTKVVSDHDWHLLERGACPQ